MDTDDLVKEFEQTVEWFCNRIMEPVPHHPKDKEKIYKRMVQTGWAREVEVEIYKDLTKPDD